jgi:hypothetical protein
MDSQDYQESVNIKMIYVLINNVSVQTGFLSCWGFVVQRNVCDGDSDLYDRWLLPLTGEMSQLPEPNL